MQDLRDKVVAHAVLPLTAFTALWIYLSDRTRSFIYQTAPYFALLAETRDGPGRKFFEANGYGNMGPIADPDMARLRPFLKDLKERLK